jgi:hypothetical protein
MFVARWLMLGGLLLTGVGCQYHTLVRRAEAQAEAGDYAAALSSYQQAAAQHTKPRNNDLATRMAGLQQAWGTRLAAAAGEEAKAGRPAVSAWLLERAVSHDPAQQAIAADQREGLQQKLPYVVDITPRMADSAPALIQLRQMLGDAPQVRLAVHDAPPTGTLPRAVDPQAALTIFYFVTEPLINIETELRTKRVEYQADLKMVPNPEYKAQQARIKLAGEQARAARKLATTNQDDMVILMDPRDRKRNTRDELAQSRQRWDDTDKAAQAKAQALEREQERLKTIPASIQQPVMKPYEFTMKVHTQRATAFLGGKFETGGGNGAKLEQNLELVNTFEDYPEQKEAKLPAMIPQIPSDDDVRRVLLQQAGQALNGLIRQQYATRGRDLLAQAQNPAVAAEARREAAAQVLLLHPEVASTEQRAALAQVIGETLKLHF